MTKKEIIIATTNKGKVNDFRVLFPEDKYILTSLLDYPEIPEVEETGSTYKENAKLKAETICKLLNTVVIADDSGLSIDALNGEPGVYSARYSGVHGDTDGGISIILEKMKDVPLEDRGAEYTCCIAVAFPDKDTMFFEGKAHGTITEERIGSNGFGFDPIFMCDITGKTWAELDIVYKNKVNHRSKAITKLIVFNEMNNIL